MQICPKGILTKGKIFRSTFYCFRGRLFCCIARPVRKKTFYEVCFSWFLFSAGHTLDVSSLYIGHTLDKALIKTLHQILLQTSQKMARYSFCAIQLTRKKRESYSWSIDSDGKVKTCGQVQCVLVRSSVWSFDVLLFLFIHLVICFHWMSSTLTCRVIMSFFCTAEYWHGMPVLCSKVDMWFTTLGIGDLRPITASWILNKHPKICFHIS